MGRGDLIRLAAVVAAALVLCASAGAALPWRLLADGPSGGTATASPVAYVALSRSAALRQFAGHLTDSVSAKLAGVDFARDALVAVFGEFGCRDSLIRVSSLVQHDKTLAISLVQQRPPPGTAQCMAIFATYRFLAIPKSSLSRPYPTRATVSLARA